MTITVRLKPRTKLVLTTDLGPQITCFCGFLKLYILFMYVCMYLYSRGHHFGQMLFKLGTITPFLYNSWNEFVGQNNQIKLTHLLVGEGECGPPNY